MDAHGVRYLLEISKDTRKPWGHDDYLLGRKFRLWMYATYKVSDFTIITFMGSVWKLTDVELLELWSQFKIEEQEHES